LWHVIIIIIITKFVVRLLLNKYVISPPYCRDEM